ncbi:hypothetical protein JXB27_02645 [Candidatus Woesearchaeota archaeon]|nr:hypothetical protein [Candidatus Woesearchaeota archaeon]
MNVKPKNISELSHPGFVLFEGMDFGGKSYVANKVVNVLREKYLLDATYNTNHGFLNPGLIDVEKIERMSSAEKVTYVLSCYRQDRLPANPADFKEIVQDRHIPSILFYGFMRASMPIERTFPLIKDVEKPKHIFLCSASYADSVNRARKRTDSTILEKRILDEPQEFRSRQHMYEDIIARFDVPTTTIDTSKLNKEECINLCISTIMKNHLMDYDVSISELCVDSFADVFPSTTERRKEDIMKNADIKPVAVRRRINCEDSYINLLEDGRHRAFASHLLGKSSIRAHIKYECGEFNVNKLVPLPAFTFREEKNE